MYKALILTHGFLPWGGAAAERAAMLARHLPAHGWQPLVLCASADGWHLFDEPTGMLLLADCKCWRVSDHTARNLSKTARRWGGSKATRAINGTLTLLTGFPDVYRLWSQWSKSVADLICDQEKPDVIFSTSPPNSTHILAQYLHRRHHIPWVMDMRDAWRGNRSARFLTPVHRVISDWQYQRAITEADRIVANAPALGALLATSLGGSGSKVKVITNGFDESLFRHAIPVRLVEPPTREVLYSGGTYAGYATQVLIDIGRCLDQMTNPEAIRIVAAGEMKGVPDGAGRCGPKGIGHQSVTRVPGQLLGADILLLIMPAPAKQIGSATVFLKSYAYLRSGKPIVYIGPENASWDLLRSFPGTYRVEAGDAERAARLLLHLAERPTDWTDARKEAIQVYDWHWLASSLATLFGELVTSG